MQIEDIKIPGHTTLAAKLYLPSDKGPFPGVLLTHGFASCKEEFMALPHVLCNSGKAVLTFDFSGHGESTGPRGFVSENSHLDDILRAYQALIERPEIDLEQTAVIGHSLGTAAVLRLLATPVAKYIKASAILAPPNQIRRSVKGIEKGLYGALYNLNKPLYKMTGKHTYIPYRIGPKDIYTSPEAIQRATTHKLLLNQISVQNYRYLMEVQDNGIYAEKVLDIPTMVMIASEDQVIDNAHSREVYDTLSVSKKEWVNMEGSGHSILGDRHAKDASQILLDWVDQFLQVPSEVDAS